MNWSELQLAGDSKLRRKEKCLQQSSRTYEENEIDLDTEATTSIGLMV